MLRCPEGTKHHFCAEASASSEGQGAESAELSTVVVQDARAHAAGVLAQIAHCHECPLAQCFTNVDFLERLYTVALAPDVSMQVRPSVLPPTPCQTRPQCV